MEITVKEFREKYFSELQDNYHTVIENNMNANRQSINQKLVKQMEGYIHFVTELQKSYPVEIGEIQMSFLYTSVYMGIPQIALTAYDEMGVLGNEITTVKYPAEWMMEGWDEYKNSILNKIKELHAQNYIREEAVNQMMKESIGFMIQCLYAVTKYLFIEFMQVKGYEELLLAEGFRLTVGGYRDWHKVLYQKKENVDLFFMDNNEKLEFCVFKEAVYQRKAFEKLNLSHTYFYDCEFVHSIFKEVDLKDAVFENCRFYYCSFEACDFCGGGISQRCNEKEQL